MTNEKMTIGVVAGIRSLDCCCPYQLSNLHCVWSCCTISSAFVL